MFLSLIQFYKYWPIYNNIGIYFGPKIQYQSGSSLKV